MKHRLGSSFARYFVLIMVFAVAHKYALYSQIYPSNFEPSPCHWFIKLIEDKGKVSCLFNMITGLTLFTIRSVTASEARFPLIT